MDNFANFYLVSEIPLTIRYPPSNDGKHKYNGYVCHHATYSFQTLVTIPEEQYNISFMRLIKMTCILSRVELVLPVYCSVVYFRNLNRQYE